jgi:uncharacterized membrane protein YeiH
MFQTATSALDWLGIIAFTVTGALMVFRKQMDVVQNSLERRAPGARGLVG